MMMTVRQLHTYIGAFIAPTVLFLAVTGALQVFSLHEAHGDYTPPQILVRLSRVHKDQVMALPKPRATPPSGQAGAAGGHHGDHGDHGDGDHAAAAGAPGAPGAGDHDHAHSPAWAVVALKWLFAAIAVGLVASTLFGLWMGLINRRNRTAVIGLVIAGTVLPVLLLVLQPS